MWRESEWSGWKTAQPQLSLPRPDLEQGPDFLSSVRAERGEELKKAGLKLAEAHGEKPFPSQRKCSRKQQQQVLMEKLQQVIQTIEVR